MKQYKVIRMFSEELQREVRVFIMLPKSYDNSDRFYPVLYMHDGHNLFDPKQSFSNVSWGILEAYQEIPDLPEVIIVGLECGEGHIRSDELVPFKFNFDKLGFPEYGKDDHGGLTDQYLSFLLEKVKPYIDKNHRTFKSPKNTGIMGSSFGGVCSTYAALKYNDHFGRFGCVSNAYYVIQEEMEELAKNSDLSNIKKLYMDVGTKETSNAIDNQRYLDSNESIYNILKVKLDDSKIKYVVAQNAIHHESAWAKRFPEIIKYLFND